MRGEEKIHPAFFSSSTMASASFVLFFDLIEMKEGEDEKNRNSIEKRNFHFKYLFVDTNRKRTLENPCLQLD